MVGPTVARGAPPADSRGGEKLSCCLGGKRGDAFGCFHVLVDFVAVVQWQGRGS
jgi:hypothetical protein